MWAYHHAGIYPCTSSSTGVLFLLMSTRGLFLLQKRGHGWTEHPDCCHDIPSPHKSTEMEDTILGENLSGTNHPIYSMGISPHALLWPLTLPPELWQRNLLLCHGVTNWQNRCDGGHMWLVTALSLPLPWTCEDLLPVSSYPLPG